MMKNLRMVVASVTLLLVGGGYMVSQLAAVLGNQAEVALRMDGMPIRLLAGFVLLSAVGCAFFQDQGDPTEEN